MNLICTTGITSLKLREEAVDTVTIALVGKYVELQDAYKSIDESLMQAATYNKRRLKLISIHSEKDYSR